MVSEPHISGNAPVVYAAAQPATARVFALRNGKGRER